MEISKEEMRSRLWTEWVNGLKVMWGDLQKDSMDIANSGCTTVIGNENFIQRAVMRVQRKSYISKFKEYKSKLNAYEDSVRELLSQANRMLPEDSRVKYKSALADVIIDGDDSFGNEAWGDHAIDAFQQLCDCADKLMDTLSKAMDALDK